MQVTGGSPVKGRASGRACGHAPSLGQARGKYVRRRWTRAEGDGWVDGILRSGDRICFLGDSITQADPGYTRLTAALLTAGRPELALSFVYAGVGGNRVGDLLARLDRDVLASGATVVTVSIGVNDVWHRHSGASGGTDDDAFALGYRSLLSRLVQAGIRPVVLTPTVVHEDPQAVENRELAVLVAGQRRIAAETGLPVCDLNAAFLAALASRRSALAQTDWPLGPDGRTRFFTTDGVHLNPAGNALAALHLLACLGGPRPAAP